MTWKLIVELPDFERATHVWTQCALNFLNEKYDGFEYVVLKGDDCVPSKVYDALRDPQAIGISSLSVGHGRDCESTVQNYLTDFSCGNENNILLKNKFFGKCSCLVGKGLLPDLANNYGLGAGTGEITEYWIVTNGLGDERDPCYWFVDANFEYDRKLMQGHTAEEAYQAMLQKYEENAKKFDESDPETASYLRYDAKNRKHFGNPQWNIPNLPPPPPTQPHKVKAHAESSKDTFMRYFKIEVDGNPYAVQTGWSRFDYEGTIYLTEGEHTICMYVSADSSFEWSGWLQVDDQKVEGKCDKDNKLCIKIGAPSPPPPPPPPPQPPAPTKYHGKYTTKVTADRNPVVQSTLRLTISGNKYLDIPMNIDLRGIVLEGTGMGEQSGVIQNGKYSGEGKGSLMVKIGYQIPVVLWIGAIPKKGWIIVKVPSSIEFKQTTEEEGEVV